MDRRRFLAASGPSVAVAVAGCLRGGRLSDGSGDENGADDGSGPGTEADGDGTSVEEDRRVTKPPQKIEPPEPPDDPEAFDEWNDGYLGEHMATEPSLAFDPLSVRIGWVRDTGLGLGTMERRADEAYEARVVADEDDYEETFYGDRMDGPLRSRLDGVDFDESVLVIVESGFGSSSVDHRWARVEADGAVVHLHGYYTAPYERNSDIDSRFSVLEIERPSEGFDLARVSLTVDADRRVRFNSTEGVVALEV
ncbi:hypothetical protein HT576_13500 [Haloterrigena sp. SYSU A121-1]|uniref:Uncharacterized protein n=1 Tax=Haloterrigena gelatinilytica TaxID=2741724 RepID=A0A8J8GLT0_9EURY|nr:hypothetical protein [Haloterrigena gelatinilytica]NUB92031.1 hypothetical protein [Haloterrigena gelatinilytica]